MLASVPLGARPRDCQGMCVQAEAGELYSPLNKWEEQACGTGGMCWEKREGEGCRP